jgi:hypothetical protein
MSRLSSDKSWRRSRFSAKRTLCVLLAVFLSLQAACSQAQAQYPPYPEKWSWFPNRSTPKVGASELRLLPNGDVLVSYDLLDGDEGEEVSFFALRRFASVEAAFGEYIPGQEQPRVELPGNLLATFHTSSPCDRGTFSAVMLRGPDGELLARKAIVVLLDQEIEYREMTCEEREYPALRSKVEVLTPSGLMALRDGTLLVPSVGSGVVIRLDRELKTKEMAAAPRVVVLDASELWAKRRAYFSGKQPTWKGFFEYLQKDLF